MPEWDVEVKWQYTETVRVEAGTPAEARAEAIHRAGQLGVAGEVTDARPLVQHGEPWVHSLSRKGWYDLHGRTPGHDVVVINRAYGHTFTEEDVTLLRDRLNAMGYKVAEHWNGARCGTVSIKCEGRPKGEDVMPPGNLVRLLAPRGA